LPPKFGYDKELTMPDNTNNPPKGDEMDPLNSAIPAKSTKNFHNYPDIENFFRFVYENELRHEAFEILSKTLIKKRQSKNT